MLDPGPLGRLADEGVECPIGDASKLNMWALSTLNQHRLPL